MRAEVELILGRGWAVNIGDVLCEMGHGFGVRMLLQNKVKVRDLIAVIVVVGGRVDIGLMYCSGWG
jgi:hypothetical protein